MGMTMVQLGHQPGGDPFAAGGMFSMADPETVRTMLSKTGFTDVHVEEMLVDWTYRSFDEAWDFLTQVAGAIARIVKELPAEETEKLRSSLEANVEPFRTDSGITLPGITINAWAS